MRKFLLDTGIVLGYVRSAGYAEYVDISHDQIIRRYAEIDAYSLGRNSVKPLPKGRTARQMGKNDLWIAATASVLKAALLTTDHDFDHLDKVFGDVVYIDPKLTRSDVGL